MRVAHIWKEPIAHVNGWAITSARIEYPHRTSTQLWYRVREEHRDLLSESSDSFVIAMLLRMMQCSDRLIVHGQVSPSLLCNLAEFQAAWHCWRPKLYRPMEIQAEVEQEIQPARPVNQAISAFSGGVDSCFTAFRHVHGTCGRVQQPLTTGLMVHGFDIPLNQPDTFERALIRSQTMLSSLGMTTIPIATNFRQVVRMNWLDVFGTALVSCLRLFQEHFHTALVPSSFSYHGLDFPFGSNPVTDPLLSSKNFAIRHDGALASRSMKIREIAQWPEVLDNLRVCWEGPQKDRNCGRCEKCIRNILCFRIMGIEHPACFDHHIQDGEILALIVNDSSLHALENVLRDARMARIKASWVNALEQCIKQNHQANRVKRQVLASLKPALGQFQSLMKTLL